MIALDAYRPDQWHDFFVMVGGGAVVLTGLVFVALSLNVNVVTQDATHRYRAIDTLTAMTGIFVICAARESRHDSSFMHIVCECGYDRCDEIIALTKGEYDGIRNDPRQFCVVQEHVIQDVEAIVKEDDRSVIVAKREGIPAEVAIRTDPRS